MKIFFQKIKILRNDNFFKVMISIFIIALLIFSYIACKETNKLGKEIQIFNENHKNFEEEQRVCNLFFKRCSCSSKQINNINECPKLYDPDVDSQNLDKKEMLDLIKFKLARMEKFRRHCCIAVTKEMERDIIISFSSCSASKNKCRCGVKYGVKALGENGKFKKHTGSAIFQNIDQSALNGCRKGWHPINSYCCKKL